jgi:PPOX class probable F420-dependent enzyme
MDGLSSLARERYVALTTFRRDGTTTSTPVWIVSDDGERLLVWTGAETWKVKRIRRDPRVRVAPSDGRGRPRGEARDGVARVLEESALVERLMLEKYGWQKRATDLAARIGAALRRRPPRRAVTLEIRPPT